PGLCSHTPHIGSVRAVGSKDRVVVGTIFPDGIEKPIVFYLVWIGSLGLRNIVFPQDISVEIFDAFPDIRGPFGAGKPRTTFAHRPVDGADFVVQSTAVTVNVFQKEMIVTIPCSWYCRSDPASDALHADGVFPFDPMDDVRIVNLKTARRSGPHPVEKVPIFDLV